VNDPPQEKEPEDPSKYKVDNGHAKASL